MSPAPLHAQRDDLYSDSPQTEVSDVGCRNRDAREKALADKVRSLVNDVHPGDGGAMEDAVRKALAEHNRAVATDHGEPLSLEDEVTVERHKLLIVTFRAEKTTWGFRITGKPGGLMALLPFGKTPLELEAELAERRDREAYEKLGFFRKALARIFR